MDLFEVKEERRKEEEEEKKPHKSPKEMNGERLLCSYSL